MLFSLPIPITESFGGSTAQSKEVLKMAGRSCPMSEREIPVQFCPNIGVYYTPPENVPVLPKICRVSNTTINCCV